MRAALACAGHVICIRCVDSGVWKNLVKMIQPGMNHNMAGSIAICTWGLGVSGVKRHINNQRAGLYVPGCCNNVFRNRRLTVLSTYVESFEHIYWMTNCPRHHPQKALQTNNVETLHYSDPIPGLLNCLPGAA